MRAPDVAVVEPAVLAEDRSRVLPRDVLAVVEVLSPGTRRTDRVAKTAEYAEAGIECCLLVEPGPPVTVTEFRLRGDVDERVAEHRDTATITLDGGAVAIDLAGILDA